MKFWFCETCGKRLTDHDIEEGLARNKKLNGVFCKDCAVGVMTMEMVPLTESDAKNLLKTSEPAAGRPRGVVTDLRSSARAAGTSPRRSEGPKPVVLIVAAVVVGIVMAVVLVALTGKSTPPTSASATPPAKPPAPPPVNSKPVPEVPKVEPIIPAPIVKSPEVPDKEPANTPPPEEPVKSKKPPKPPDPPPAEVKKPPAVSDRVAHQKIVREAYALLRGQQEKAAREKLEKARDEATAPEAKTGFANDILFTAWPAEINKALADGAAMLVAKKPAFIFKRDDGKDLPTGSGSKNVIKSYQDETFSVEQNIGGGFVTIKVPLRTLLPEAQEQLILMGMPPGPETQLKFLLNNLLSFYAGGKGMTAEQLKTAIAAVGKAGAPAPLCAHMLRRIDEQAREHQANDAFAKVKAACEASKSLESGKLLRDFLQAHADTEAWHANKALLDQWQAEILAQNDPLNQPGPVTDDWVAAVQALPAEDQFKRVEAKLLEFNPKMGKVAPRIEDDKIIGLRGTGKFISNTTPLRALVHLREIILNESAGHEGKFDLAPLKDLPLIRLELYNLRTPDLSPLRGSRVQYLNIGGPLHAGLEPLTEMPHLKGLHCDMPATEKSAAVVRQLKKLIWVNGKRVDDFLKSCK